MSVYRALTPARILDAVEAVCGQRCDGRLQALNSYENRVYQLWLEDGRPVVVKFYRPRRWSEAAIQEEQDFATELAARELPVVAPLAFNGRTLHEHGGFLFALTPRRGGRTPELDDADTLRWMGRFVARIHAVGQLQAFRHRPVLDIQSFACEPVQFVLDGDFVPDELYDTYASVAEDLVERVERRWAAAGAVRNIRLHGDCHAGNVLWTDAGPHFVDLDDARMGPAVQDLWMCLSGGPGAQQAQLRHLLEGYCEFRDFDAAELMLVEVLRTLRIVHYAGWLARRWDDPAFPANFPFFNTRRYWQDHILALREQAAALDEPPLQWLG
jgi:Ser/Thr protein kinase RdoA (MazF antagonist)